MVSSDRHVDPYQLLLQPVLYLTQSNSKMVKLVGDLPDSPCNQQRSVDTDIRHNVMDLN